ncbi:MAG: peptidylprolyl isomerase, partial [Owenweeksia sp.]
NQKYTVAIQKGMYMPVKMARMEYMRNSASSTALFLAMEYSTVSDSMVEVSEADYKKYYNEHKEDYKSEGNRSIEFVNFRIEPSQTDRDEVIEELRGFMSPQFKGKDTIASFATTDDDSTFAANRSDLRVAGLYYRKENLPAGVDSTIMDREKGYVAGPYEDGNYSVNARHILITFNNGQNNAELSFADAKSLADSLLTVLQADSTQFTDLALQYSDDPGSKIKGGNLGWFDDRSMVKPFSDFCFHNKKGKIGLVTSQFGFHIIQIMDQKGSTKAVKLVNISRELAPSDQTYDDVYNEASAFAAQVNGTESFSSTAEEKGYNPRPITNLKAFDESIPGLGVNREIVKWAHDEETEIGDIQLFNNNNNSFVVVILTEKEEEGYASLESIKETIKPVVIRQKKAEQFKEKFNKARGEGKDLTAIASELNLEVKNQVMNFSGAAISGYGREPKVVGVMCGIELNKVSQPIEGERGVYLVQVTNRAEANELPDYTSQQLQATTKARSAVPGNLFNSLKDDANIKDRRAEFY